MADCIRGPRAALIAFTLWLIVSAVALLLIGRGLWATADDWMLTGPRSWSDPASLLRDHNQHFSLVPVVIYKSMFHVLGFSEYWPYRVVGVAIHLALVVLLRVFMRTTGIGPWIATMTAGCLTLFNGGGLVLSQFQMPLGMSLGLGTVLIAMRPHLTARATAGAIVLGVLAVATSGVALPMVLAAGVIAWRRQDLRHAALLTVPVGLLYIGWWIWDSPTAGHPVGWTASLRGLLMWLVRGLAGVFEALAGGWVLGVLLAAAVLAGLLTRGSRPLRVRLLEPGVLAGASVVLLALTYLGRGFDPLAVTQSRFLYLVAAMVLPLVAVAWEGVIGRHAGWGVLIALPLALGLIGNVQGLREETAVSRGLLNYERELVAAMLRSPAAESTPDWVRPWWSTGFFGVGDTTWGYLEAARAAGRLRLDAVPVSPEAQQGALVRLRLAQLGEDPPSECTAHAGPVVRSLPAGTRVGFRGGAASPEQSWINIRLKDSGAWQSDFRADAAGDTILVVGGDPSTGMPLKVEISPGSPNAMFYLCP